MTDAPSPPTGVLSRSNQLIVLVLASMLATYFPAAYWYRQSYVPLPEPKGAIIHLQSFHTLGPPGTFGYYSVAQFIQKEADTADAPERSPYVLYENGKPLGPAHSSKEDIELIGRGRFGHIDSMFMFAASDNSDPRVNGRTYWVVLPPK